MLPARRDFFFEWFTLSFDLNIFFGEVFTRVIARGCSDPINQRDWTSHTSLFLTLERRLSPQRRPHINQYELYTNTLMHTHTPRPDYNGCSSALHQQMTNSLSFSPVDRSVWVLHEFPFLFITLWCPAAPVNTFLQLAIHCNILAAETPVMNFNLPFAEGASPWVGLIKGNTPFQEGGRLQTDWAQVTP